MSDRPPHVWAVEAGDVGRLRPRLGELLIDSVHHGASIGFLDPLTAGDADAYWLRIERAVAEAWSCSSPPRSTRPVTGPSSSTSTRCPTSPIGRPSASCSSSPRPGGGGSAKRSWRSSSESPLERGRWLLTLDTATAEAVRLYERYAAGARPGAIPDYAMNPDRSLTPTTFYWKDLRHSSAD